MVRSIASISVGIALTVAGASLAGAQALPAGPLPGTGDSTKISAGNAANNAEYNHLIGSGEAKPSANDDRRPARKTAPVAATAADIHVGNGLRDIAGTRLGTVAAVDVDGVVVDTGTTKIKVPVTAFGKDSDGLMLGITAARFNELVAKAHSSN
jgi:hypothetical protein